jgi:pimeloyl-ACP methyl ester carboxylesterase
MSELKQVYKPVNSAGKPRIVFVHGLGGHFRETWMHNKKDDATLWPKWIGQDVGCPIWLFGYASGMSRWASDVMAPTRQGGALLESLSSEPGLEDGPLVLIGHSLGGLVIKKALHRGLGFGVERHVAVARRIRGVVFIGTPHFGSFLASIALGVPFFRPSPQIKDLEAGNAELEELNGFFLQNVATQKIKARVYVETQPLRAPWLFGRVLPGITVVSTTSSLAHIPGEVGVHIQANHFSICKPESKEALLHKSVRKFIQEIQATPNEPPQAFPLVASSSSPLPSNRVEAIEPSLRPDTVVHLAVATSGLQFNEGLESDASACVCLCLVSDEPELLRKTLQDISRAVANDPLVSSAAKKNAAGASLEELVRNPATRNAVRRILEVTPFSAYMYYCRQDEFDLLEQKDSVQRILISPLAHRLSKKGVQVQRYYSRIPNLEGQLVKAAEEVKMSFHRTVLVPVVGETKFSKLEQLASVIAWASSKHLANLSDDNATDIFEIFRTRIRYAENVVSGEKHKRDENPLP